MIKLNPRLAVLAALLAAFAVTGCVNDNNRTTTTAEVQAADVKRQSFIDSVPNLSPEQRAQMKAHMGGGEAPAMGRGPAPEAAGGPAPRTGYTPQPGNGPPPSMGYSPQPGNGPPVGR